MTILDLEFLCERCLQCRKGLEERVAPAEGSPELIDDRRRECVCVGKRKLPIRIHDAGPVVRQVCADESQTRAYRGNRIRPIPRGNTVFATTPYLINLDRPCILVSGVRCRSV